MIPDKTDITSGIILKVFSMAQAIFNGPGITGRIIIEKAGSPAFGIGDADQVAAQIIVIGGSTVLS
jgi:hypothetical protein